MSVGKELEKLNNTEFMKGIRMLSMFMATTGSAIFLISFLLNLAEKEKIAKEIKNTYDQITGRK